KTKGGTESTALCHVTPSQQSKLRQLLRKSEEDLFGQFFRGTLARVAFGAQVRKFLARTVEGSADRAGACGKRLAVLVAQHEVRRRLDDTGRWTAGTVGLVANVHAYRGQRVAAQAKAKPIDRTGRVTGTAAEQEDEAIADLLAEDVASRIDRHRSKLGAHVRRHAAAYGSTGASAGGIKRLHGASSHENRGPECENRNAESFDCGEKAVRQRH